MSCAEGKEVGMWRSDFRFGISDEVDAEMGQQSLALLFVATAARFRRLMFNCRLSDRVRFIEVDLDLGSTVFEENVLRKLAVGFELVFLFASFALSSSLIVLLLVS